PKEPLYKVKVGIVGKGEIRVRKRKSLREKGKLPAPMPPRGVRNLFEGSRGYGPSPANVQNVTTPRKSCCPFDTRARRAHENTRRSPPKLLPEIGGRRRDCDARRCRVGVPGWNEDPRQ